MVSEHPPKTSNQWFLCTRCKYDDLYVFCTQWCMLSHTRVLSLSLCRCVRRVLAQQGNDAHALCCMNVARTVCVCAQFVHNSYAVSMRPENVHRRTCFFEEVHSQLIQVLLARMHLTHTQRKHKSYETHTTCEQNANNSPQLIQYAYNTTQTAHTHTKHIQKAGNMHKLRVKCVHNACA